MSGIFPYSSSGGGTPGGADTQIQFNNAGAFDGASDLTYVAADTELRVPLYVDGSTKDVTYGNLYPLVAGDSGGTVIFRAWDAVGAGLGSQVQVYAGAGLTQDGGALDLRSGASGLTQAGDVFVFSGGGVTRAGDVDLTAADSSGVAGLGGNIRYVCGSDGGLGTPGQHIFSVDGTPATTSLIMGSIAGAATIGSFGAPGVIQPIVGGAAAAFVAGAGVPILAGSTFDGYTLAQAIKALRNLGWLA